MTRRVVTGAVVLLAGLTVSALWAQEGRGALEFDVKTFRSDVKVKKKLLAQFETGSVAWGVEADQLVISMVDQQHLAVKVPNVTPYGEKKSLELDPGVYKISCVGFVPIVDPEEADALDEGAYVNVDFLTFTITAGKTTRLEVQPTVHKYSVMFDKYEVADLMVTVIEDGVPLSNRVINAKTATSIPWAIYEGPLRKR